MARYYQYHRNPYRRPTCLPRFPHSAIGNAPRRSRLPALLAQTRPQPLRLDKDDGCTGDRIESLIALANNGRASSSARLLRKVNCCGEQRLCRLRDSLSPPPRRSIRRFTAANFGYRSGRKMLRNERPSLRQPLLRTCLDRSGGMLRMEVDVYNLFGSNREGSRSGRFKSLGVVDTPRKSRQLILVICRYAAYCSYSRVGRGRV